MAETINFLKEENERLKRQNAVLRSDNQGLRRTLTDLRNYADRAVFGKWRHAVYNTCRDALNNYG